MRHSSLIPTLLAAAVFSVAANPCFAGPAEEETSPDIQTSPSHFKSWTGEITSVQASNSDTGARSELVVKGKDRKLTFLLGPSTRVMDKDGKAIQPADLKTGSKVTVEYKTRADASYKAQTIKVQGNGNPAKPR